MRHILTFASGNLHRLFKDGLKYNLELFKRYGGVIKVYGMLGVSLSYRLADQPERGVDGTT